MPLRWQTLVPGRPPEGLGLFVPDDPNRVLENLDDGAELEAGDERIPYFATLWPAAESLATEILRGPSLDGRRVLDLGCGLGALGLAAARRGARVWLLDWEPRALQIARRSAKALGLALEGTIVADWRETRSFPAFDLVLAADVLYEPRNLDGVSAFLARALGAGGEAWIADPRRKHAAGFPQRARAHGLAIREERVLPGLDHGQTVTLLRVARVAAAGRYSRPSSAEAFDSCDESDDPSPESSIQA